MAVSKERQARLRELRKMESADTKICSCCEQLLPLASFTKESKNRKDLSSRCRKCVQSKRFEKNSTDPATIERIQKQVEARSKETDSTKACSVCFRVLPLKYFSKAKGRRKGVSAECKECRKEYKRRTKEHNRWVAIYRLYGITQEQFEMMLNDQQGKCKICSTSDPGRYGFEVDHDHTTGKVRGLLCHRCNKAIGLLNDNVDTMLAAAKYLEGSK